MCHFHHIRLATFLKLAIPSISGKLGNNDFLTFIVRRSTLVLVVTLSKMDTFSKQMIFMT